MIPFKIFIVEDDPWYGEMLKYHLSLNPEFEVHLFKNGQSCLKNLHLKPNVICIDYYLPDINGQELFNKIKANHNTIDVIIISGQENINIALNFLKNGVYDYIVKNENTKKLVWNSVLKIKEKATLIKEIKNLKTQLATKFDFEKLIIGKSKAIRKSFELVEDAIKTNINVSISGETGTGKELVAKAIHYNSNKSKKPFVAINMGAIPKELIESELFGHEKGAFTGAYHQKIGKFEEADGGSLFLDEIAELDVNTQVKLLRVLQERELTRIGGNKTIKFNTRLITTTNKNLAEEVQKGTFRKDLYYRIIGLPIHLPPLRERGNDILILAKHFINTFSTENKTSAPSLNETAKEKLMQHHYPGNVRELKSIIELACATSHTNKITANDITFTNLMPETHLSQTEKTLRAYNIEIIHHFLKKHKHNIAIVADKLNIGKSTIYKMIKSGEIDIANV